MIQIECRNERFTYDMYHIVKSFFPDAAIIQTVEPEQESLIHIRIDGDSCFCSQEFQIVEEEISEIEDKREQKRYINRKLYRMLSDLTGQVHAWGDMTGVRPTKMVMEKLEEGKSDQEIVDFMKDTYEVSEKKAKLGIEIAKQEKRQLEKLDYENGYSLYIGIPFCPTTCSYCSFTSYPIVRWESRVDAYVEALLKELSGIAKKAGKKKLNTIYIGGGTPTTLEAVQLERIFSHLEKNFSFADLKEFTVEAGRPDSITQEKLAVIRRHPAVDRISINPQTMQQRTLDAVGRRHTVEDIRNVFSLARKMGFQNINMDLIAGLPGEHPEDMEDTLRQIEELAPDSLTVHALAMKHGSRLAREKKERQMEENPEDRLEYTRMARELEEMIDMAARYAEKMNLAPYYLYRQKNIAGNFENVGYAKVDKAGIYNILIMEERQSIIAAGAGATTKMLLSEEIDAPGSRNGRKTNLIRIENVKDVEEYILRIDEMIERKGEWLWR
ncbi:MAG: coproporphyrinogen dehydrogenase HemZ [Coprococcus sp.]|nr:coproporphyrinogen dehydrogenase HemZ [Coprococcus sp.]